MARSDDDLDLASVRLRLRHDLRGLLAVVIGRVDLLMSEVQGPLTADQRRSLEVILRNAERIEALGADLADRIDPAGGSEDSPVEGPKPPDAPAGGTSGR